MPTAEQRPAHAAGAAPPRARAPAAERRGRRDLAQQAEGDGGRGQERRDAAAAHPPHQRQQRRHREHGRAVHQEACARAARWSGTSAGRSRARMQPSAWGSCSTEHRCAGVTAVRLAPHGTSLRACPASPQVAQPRTERGGAGGARQPVRPPQKRAEDRRRRAGGVRRRAGCGVREEDRERDRQRPRHDGHPLAATRHRLLGATRRQRRGEHRVGLGMHNGVVHATARATCVRCCAAAALGRRAPGLPHGRCRILVCHRRDRRPETTRAGRSLASRAPHLQLRRTGAEARNAHDDGQEVGRVHGQRAADEEQLQEHARDQEVRQDRHRVELPPGRPRLKPGVGALLRRGSVKLVRR